jgi:hypothetical protein
VVIGDPYDNTDKMGDTKKKKRVFSDIGTYVKKKYSIYSIIKNIGFKIIMDKVLDLNKEKNGYVLNEYLITKHRSNRIYLTDNLITPQKIFQYS